MPRLPKADGRSGYSPTSLEALEPGKERYDSKEVLDRYLKTRRRLISLGGLVAWLILAPTILGIWTAFTDDTLTGLVVWFIVTATGVAVQIIFKRKASYKPATRDPVEQPVPAEANTVTEEEVKEMSADTQAAVTNDTAAGIDAATNDDPVAKGQLSAAEKRFVKQYAKPRLRSIWQPRLPALLILVVGAIGMLDLARQANAPTLNVLIGLVLVGVVAYCVYLLTRKRFAYTMTEKNIPAKVHEDLMMHRAKVRSALAGSAVEDDNRAAFWYRLFKIIAHIQAYFKIDGFCMRVYAANFKGEAGKTVVLQNTGSFIKLVVNNVVGVLISATRDRDIPSPGRHAGIDRKDPNVLHHTEFTDRVKGEGFADGAEFQGAMRHNANFHGLYIVVEDSPEGENGEDAVVETTRQLSTNVEEDNPYPPQDFEGDLNESEKQGALTLIDGNNNSSNDGTIPYIAGNHATVITFVANNPSVISLESMQDTKLRYGRQGTVIPLQEGEKPRNGCHVPTYKKVRDTGVFVLTNVKEGEVADFDTYTEGAGCYNAVIHDDPYMRNVGKKFLNPINLFLLRLRTFMEIAELALAWCQVSAHNLGLDDSHIAAIEPNGTEFWHPQMQSIDKWGRFIGTDTTPTQAEWTPESSGSVRFPKSATPEPAPADTPATPDLPEQAGATTPSGETPAVVLDKTPAPAEAAPATTPEGLPHSLATQFAPPAGMLQEKPYVLSTTSSAVGHNNRGGNTHE